MTNRAWLLLLSAALSACAQKSAEEGAEPAPHRVPRGAVPSHPMAIKKRLKRLRRSLMATRAVPGAPPGTLIRPPDHAPPLIRVIAYCDGSVEERQCTTVEEVRAFRRAGWVLWVNIDGLGERIVLRETPFPRSERPELGTVAPAGPSEVELADEVYRALVVGTRDYVRKNGFRSVVIGLSGGIDSALVACVAADALGPENVSCVFMPTRYSSSESGRDAETLARNLGVRYQVVAIEETFRQYLDMLAPAFAGTPMGIAEENLQARIRGNILMALSNKFGALVLSTGNKSEMSVGYSTLYGDMCGGYAVIKDVPKMLVYELSRYVNRRGPAPVIPEYILTRAPSAELRENQTDQDSLPPYAVLDAILERYVEEDLSAEAIIAEGFAEKTVRWVLRQVDISEYKRRQAAPGVKITPRAFGRDRRMPITNKFHG